MLLGFPDGQKYIKFKETWCRRIITFHDDADIQHTHRRRSKIWKINTSWNAACGVDSIWCWTRHAGETKSLKSSTILSCYLLKRKCTYKAINEHHHDYYNCWLENSLHMQWVWDVGDASGLTVWSRWQRQFKKVSTVRKKLFKVELQSDAMMVEGERTDVHLDGSCEGSKRSFLGTRRRVWLRKLQQSSLIFPSHKSDESEARVHLNLLSPETRRVTMTSRRERELHEWIF